MSQIHHLFLKFFILSCLLSAKTSFAQNQPLVFLAEDLPPYHFINSQGQADGVMVEIINAVLSKAELTGTVKIQPLARSFQAARTKKNHFMLSLLKTPKRSDEFKWVGETYKSYAVLVGLKNRKNIKLATLADAKSYMVGTIRGYHSVSFLLNNDFQEKDNLSLSVTSKHMWAMLFNNRIDFVFTNYMALDRDIKNAGFDAENIVPYLLIEDFPNQLNIAAGPHTSDAMVEKLSTALKSIKQSGVYQNILDKYNL